MKPALFLVLALVTEEVARADESNDEDCTPAIAERCFVGFWNETLNSGKDSNDICSVVNDQISCAQDIIDDGCRKEQGRDNFDSWISGINAVYSFLCKDNQKLVNGLGSMQHHDTLPECRRAALNPTLDAAAPSAIITLFD